MHSIEIYFNKLLNNLVASFDQYRRKVYSTLYTIECNYQTTGKNNPNEAQTPSTE
jgi:hypothetical protein